MSIKQLFTYYSLWHLRPVGFFLTWYRPWADEAIVSAHWSGREHRVGYPLCCSTSLQEHLLVPVWVYILLKPVVWEIGGWRKVFTDCESFLLLWVGLLVPKFYYQTVQCPAHFWNLGRRGTGDNNSPLLSQTHFRMGLVIFYNVPVDWHY